MSTIDQLMTAALQSWRKAECERFDRDLAAYNQLFPRDPNWVPPPPAPPAKYQPSERAKTLLRQLRAATRKGKNRLELLKLIDAVLTDVEDETREQWSDR